MDWDEPDPKKKSLITLGDDLSTMSINDLNARISLLRAEIERHERDIAEKQKRRSVADDIFKKGP